MSNHTGVCNFCGTGCGHLLEVEDGAVRGVYPFPRASRRQGTPLRPRLAHPRASDERGPHRPAAPPGRRPAPRGVLGRGPRRRGGPAGRLYAATRSASGPRRALSNEDVYALVRLARSTFRSPQHRPAIRFRPSGLVPRPRRRDGPGRPCPALWPTSARPISSWSSGRT